MVILYIKLSEEESLSLARYCSASCSLLISTKPDAAHLHHSPAAGSDPAEFRGKSVVIQ